MDLSTSSTTVHCCHEILSYSINIFTYSFLDRSVSDLVLSVAVSFGVYLVSSGNRLVQVSV